MNAAKEEQNSSSKRLLLAVLTCVFALQVHSWNTLDGYQLADSVEYMERARNLAIGQEVRVDGAVRSFGFSRSKPVSVAGTLAGTSQKRRKT